MVLVECFKKRKKNQEKVDQEKVDQEKGEKKDQKVDQEKGEGQSPVDSLVGFKVIFPNFYKL